MNATSPGIGERRERPTIGIVGGGQLALMLFEASLRLELDIRVLASRSDDSTVGVVPDVRIGDPRDPQVLAAFADGCDVVTFDHELVDPVVLAALEDDGTVLHPAARTMAIAVDKLAQYQLFRAAGLPVPETVVARDADTVRRAAEAFGYPVVVKFATGGYDGRGVAVVDSPLSAPDWPPAGDQVALVQRLLDIERELAVVAVRSTNGEIVTYPVVATVQEGAMCRLVHVPAGIAPALAQQAESMARHVAELMGVVGVLAVEFFAVDGALLLNEVAARPHNSGHITIEASVTSQFENHLRAVTGQTLGATDLVVAAASMVNVVGSTETPGGRRPLPADAAVHLYRKAPRPGRKLGHVTAVADSVEQAVHRALQAATCIERGGIRP